MNKFKLNSHARIIFCGQHRSIHDVLISTVRIIREEALNKFYGIISYNVTQTAYVSVHIRNLRSNMYLVKDNAHFRVLEEEKKK